MFTEVLVTLTLIELLDPLPPSASWFAEFDGVGVVVDPLFAACAPPAA